VHPSPPLIQPRRTGAAASGEPRLAILRDPISNAISDLFGAGLKQKQMRVIFQLPGLGLRIAAGCLACGLKRHDAILRT
jgi:hypothetical protein